MAVHSGTLVRISLFGQPRVVAEDGSREFALPRKTLNVLAYLILNSKRPSSRDSVAFAIFPDEDEEKARGRLRRNLSDLLSALPSTDGVEPFVHANAEKVAWNLEAPAHVDVFAFERAIAQGRDDDAIAEYAGLLLPTLYDDWTTADRERFREKANDALSRMILRDRSLRRFDAATATAHRLLDDDPWREDIIRQLMAVRYEAGDRAGSLSVYERFAVALRDEMQTEPMPETIRMRDIILRGAQLATSEPRRRVAPPAVAPEPSLPFVGRDATIERAHEAWQSAADGRGAVLFVSGEAGVGKSRFTTELVRITEREGGSILRGFTSAGGERQPYEPFLEALHGAQSVLDEYAGASLTNDRAARLRLFDGIRKELTSLAASRPLVLVLEDLHWSGTATIDLLEFVAQRLGNAPALIVATSRSDELARAHPLRNLRRKLQTNGSATEIVLERLSIGDATRAARAALPQSIDETALTRALQWVDGVPLLLLEAVRDLAAGRSSTASTMTGLLAERLNLLSSSAETALIFGAVLGERFDLATLVAATGWRDDQILDAIGESIEYGIVRAAPRTPGLSFAFTHDLMRVAATERIPKPDLTRAHGLVARAISAQAPNDPTRSGQIAGHFAAAGENLRAAQYYGKAARYALDVFANDDARTSATAGLDLCDEGDVSQRAVRYELIDLREQALARIGATDERRTDAHTLVSLADGDDAKAIALGRLFEAYHTDAAGRRNVLEQLTQVSAASPKAGLIHAHAEARHLFAESAYERAYDAARKLALAYEMATDVRGEMKARMLSIDALARLGRFPESKEILDRLREDVSSLDDDVLRWEFHIVASAAPEWMSRREDALEDARRALALGLRMGDRFAEARAHQNVAAAAGKLRLYEESLKESERAVEAFRDVGSATNAADALLNIVSVRMFCGEYEIAGRLFNEVKPETPWLELRCRLIRSFLARRTGNLNDAERFYREVQELSEKLGASMYHARVDHERAHMLLAQGHLDEADAALSRALAAFSRMKAHSLEIEAWAFAAQLQAMRGNAAGAREYAQLAANRLAEGRIQSHSEAAWYIASAHAIMGDTREAEKFASIAAEAAVDDALRMAPELAETYMRHPFHVATIAYLQGREVSLRPN